MAYVQGHCIRIKWSVLFQPSPGLYLLKVGSYYDGIELSTEVVVDQVNRTEEWWEDVNYYQRECAIPAQDLTATVWYVLYQENVLTHRLLQYVTFFWGLCSFGVLKKTCINM